jgi:hypothetical protein
MLKHAYTHTRATLTDKELHVRRCVEPVGAALDSCKEKSSSKMDDFASAIERGFTSIGNFAAPIEKSVVSFLDSRVTPKLKEVAKWGDSKLGGDTRPRAPGQKLACSVSAKADVTKEEKEA